MWIGRLGLGMIQSSWDMQRGDWTGKDVHRRALRLRQETGLKVRLAASLISLT